MAGAVNVYNPSTGKRGAPGGGGYVSATPSTPAPVVTTPVTPAKPTTPTTPATPSAVTLPFSKDTPTYKALVAKGYTDQMIVDAYQKAKTVQPAKIQAIMTQQEQHPVAPIKPTVIKPIKPVEVVKTPQQLQQEANIIRYSDNSEARMAEITNNLNQMAITNPNALKDVASFRNAYSYTQRSPEQQAVLSNRYTGYQKGVTLGLTPTNDIVTGYDNGTITSTDLETLKTTNPTKYADVQTAIETKKSFNNYKDMLYGKDETATPLVDTSVSDTSSNLFDTYKAAIASPEVTGLQSSMADQDGKITTLKLELTKIQNDVEKTYEGSGASTSKIAAIVADQQQDIQNQISKLSIDYNTSVNKYNSIVGTAKDIMTMGLQEKSAEQADRQAKMNELGFFYQSTPEGISQMATMKYNAENPDINSSNPVTSKMALNQALDEYYKDFGDIIQRPKAQAVTDILNYAKSKGISVSQALKDNFVSPLQGKSEYKSKVASDYGMNVVSSLMGGGSASVGAGSVAPSGNIAQLKLGSNGATVRVDSVASGSLQSAFSQMSDSGVSAVAGSSLRTKEQQALLVKEGKSWTMDSKHLTGMAIDIYASNKLDAPTQAQVSIMNQNGWYQPAETMAKDDYGHFEYKGGGSTGGTQSQQNTGFDVSLASVYSQVNTNSPLDNERLSKQYEIPVPELARQAQARKINNLSQGVTNTLNAVDILNNTYPGRIAAMASATSAGQLNGALADFNAQFNYIKDNLTMDKLVALKNSGATFGALSDQERIAIGNAANAINLKMTQTEFKRQLGIIAQQLKLSIGGVDPRTSSTVTPQFSLDNYYSQYQGAGTVNTDLPDYPTN